MSASHPNSHAKTRRIASDLSSDCFVLGLMANTLAILHASGWGRYLAIATEVLFAAGLLCALVAWVLARKG